MKKTFRQKLWQAAPWLWMAAGYVYMLWYHIVPGKWIIDSDLAAEMVLADLLNKEGGLLTTNWFYSRELRVFHMQWFYRLGLLVFPHDWHAARVLAMALVLLVVAAACLFFARAAGMGQNAVWFAAAMIWPFGFWYLFLCLYGGYYLIYIIFSLLTLGIVLHLRQHLSRPAALICLGLGAALGLMSGLNGVRQLMVLYAPLSAALLVLVILQIRAVTPHSLREAFQACQQTFRMLGGTLLFTACNAAGYLVNLLVLAKNHFFEAYDHLSWHPASTSPMTFLREFLLLFGFQPGPALFSFNGIASGLGLLLGLAVLVSLVLLVLRFARLELRHQVIVAFTLSGLFIQALVFCFLGPYSQNYWLPYLPFGLVALLLAVQTGTFRLRGTRPLLVLSLAACLSVCSVATVKWELAQPLHGKAGLDSVVTWLIDRGYTGGYSPFWTSQAIAELSDGQLEMWTLTEYGDSLFQWLQPIDHTERVPEAPYFALFEEGTIPEDFASGTEVYRDDRYIVLEYTDPYAVANSLH